MSLGRVGTYIYLVWRERLERIAWKSWPSCWGRKDGGINSSLNGGLPHSIDVKDTILEISGLFAPFGVCFQHLVDAFDRPGARYTRAGRQHVWIVLRFGHTHTTAPTEGIKRDSRAREQQQRATDMAKRDSAASSGLNRWIDRHHAFLLAF